MNHDDQKCKLLVYAVLLKEVNLAVNLPTRSLDPSTVTGTSEDPNPPQGRFGRTPSITIYHHPSSSMDIYGLYGHGSPVYPCVLQASRPTPRPPKPPSPSDRSRPGSSIRSGGTKLRSLARSPAPAAGRAPSVVSERTSGGTRGSGWVRAARWLALMDVDGGYFKDIPERFRGVYNVLVCVSVI